MDLEILTSDFSGGLLKKYTKGLHKEIIKRKAEIRLEKLIKAVNIQVIRLIKLSSQQKQPLVRKSKSENKNDCTNIIKSVDVKKPKEFDLTNELKKLIKKESIRKKKKTKKILVIEQDTQKPIGYISSGLIILKRKRKNANQRKPEQNNNKIGQEKSTNQTESEENKNLDQPEENKNQTQPKLSEILKQKGEIQTGLKENKNQTESQGNKKQTSEEILKFEDQKELEENKNQTSLKETQKEILKYEDQTKPEKNKKQTQQEENENQPESENYCIKIPKRNPNWPPRLHRQYDEKYLGKKPRLQQEMMSVKLFEENENQTQLEKNENLMQLEENENKPNSENYCIKIPKRNPNWPPRLHRQYDEKYLGKKPKLQQEIMLVKLLEQNENQTQLEKNENPTQFEGNEYPAQFEGNENQPESEKYCTKIPRRNPNWPPRLQRQYDEKYSGIKLRLQEENKFAKLLKFKDIQLEPEVNENQSELEIKESQTELEENENLTQLEEDENLTQFKGNEYPAQFERNENLTQFEGNENLTQLEEDENQPESEKYCTEISWRNRNWPPRLQRQYDEIKLRPQEKKEFAKLLKFKDIQLEPEVNENQSELKENKNQIEPKINEDQTESEKYCTNIPKRNPNWSRTLHKQYDKKYSGKAPTLHQEKILATLSEDGYAKRFLTRNFLGQLTRAALQRPISTENRGFKMMEKMGYKAGTGLGKNNTGIIEPISNWPNQKYLKEGKGLGFKKRKKKGKFKNKEKECVNQSNLINYGKVVLIQYKKGETSYSKWQECLLNLQIQKGSVKQPIQKSSLKEPIKNTNKGFVMLEKMGYKKGTGLGKNSTGMLEPLEIQPLRSIKHGIGYKETKEKTLREKELERLQNLNRALENQMKKNQTEEEILKSLRKNQSMCKELDLRNGIKTPMKFWFWPEEDFPESEETESQVDEEELSNLKKLEILNQYLNDNYLLWDCFEVDLFQSNIY